MIYPNRKKKTSDTLIPILCLTVVSLALIIACIMIIPKRIKATKEGSFPVEIDETYSGYSSNSSEAREVALQAERVRSAAAGESTESTTTGTSDNSSVEATANQSDTEQPQTEQPNTESASENEGPVFTEAIRGDIVYTSVGRPSISDFKYLMDRDPYSIPNGGIPLTFFDEITGDWKAYIQYTSPDSDGTISRLLNIKIGNTKDAVETTWDWYQISYFGDPFEDETDLSDTSYSGYYTNGVLALYGDASITIDSFYLYEDKEYAVGSLFFENSKTSAIISMVRP